MKVFKLPEISKDQSKPAALIFDMDNTLYTHDEYVQSQTDLPIKRLAELHRKTFNEMKKEIEDYRKNWAEKNEGKSLSLGNTFLNFGISIKENILWREELCKPENYLKKDFQLRCVLQVLSSRFKFAVVTNNPVSVAIRTLTVLGVEDLFQNIVGLDTFCISKPDKAHFTKAAELCETPIEQCISIGDRYDIDIALPLEMGMGGILVDGVEDVYELPDLLVY